MKEFSEEEIQFIKDNYPAMGMKQIAKHLKTRGSNVTKIVNELNLKTPVIDAQIGDKFNKLTILEKVKIKKECEPYYRTFVICKCECGNVADPIRLDLVVQGKVLTCGCLRKEQVAQLNRTHGKSKKCKAYAVWVSIKNRCNCDEDYKDVEMCQEWAEDFEVFEKWFLESGYQEGLTIDRKDSTKGYFPENCRWATYQEQANNKRNTVYLSAFGEQKTAANWARDPRCQVSYSSLQSRLNRNWDVEQAISTPVISKSDDIQTIL